MANEYKINGTTIKKPSEFTIERYNLTKSGRVASGLMVMELIAKKRKFLLNYGAISGTELNVILGLIDGTDMFFTFTYTENGTEKTADCYVGAIPTKVHRRDGVWMWKDISFDLIER